MAYKIGPVILDVSGPELTVDDKEILEHPSVAGVILFSRHYENPTQLKQLCLNIRKSRKSPILIMVDQEGGQVQRFQEGFSKIPSMEEIGHLYQRDAHEAIKNAHTFGYKMARELLAVGIDLSLAPVLDLHKGLNPITNKGRAFHKNPQVVFKLAKAFIEGMQQAGMAATGKHFPGHGSVKIDTHVAMPIDERALNLIECEDMVPFKQLIAHGMDLIMPAHILFPAVDDKPACFSEVWLNKILREKLNFQGLIISDDLNMGGANFVPYYAERALLALNAGCNLILICNNRSAAIEIIEQLPQNYFLPFEKFTKVQGKFQ